MITNKLRGHSASTPNKSPTHFGTFILSHSPGDLIAGKPLSHFTHFNRMKEVRGSFGGLRGQTTLFAHLPPVHHQIIAIRARNISPDFIKTARYFTYFNIFHYRISLAVVFPGRALTQCLHKPTHYFPAETQHNLLFPDHLDKNSENSDYSAFTQ
jgi:hypothetical protein